MIKNIQIDTTGFCGSQCWYCPVRYIPRPTQGIMKDFEFRNILEEAANLNPKPGLWLAAYNDILLDPLLEFRLEAMRDYGFAFAVITNGIGLSKNGPLLYKYRDVIAGFSIDVPAGNAKDYKRFTLNSSDVFDQIILGITLLYNNYSDAFGNMLNITVNGVYDDEYARNQLKFPMPMGDTDKQIAQLTELLPFAKVNGARPLCDRAGNLAEFAIDNSTSPCRDNWKLPMGATKASGCNAGDRLESWLHFASNLDVYTCCQDYRQVHTYANKLGRSLQDIIDSQERKVAIAYSLEDLCPKCQFSF